MLYAILLYVTIHIIQVMKHQLSGPCCIGHWVLHLGTKTWTLCRFVQCAISKTAALNKQKRDIVFDSSRMFEKSCEKSVRLFRDCIPTNLYTVQALWHGKKRMAMFIMGFPSLPVWTGYNSALRSQLSAKSSQILRASSTFEKLDLTKDLTETGTRNSWKSWHQTSTTVSPQRLGFLMEPNGP